VRPLAWIAKTEEHRNGDSGKPERDATAANFPTRSMWRECTLAWGRFEVANAAPVQPAAVASGGGPRRSLR